MCFGMWCSSITVRILRKWIMRRWRFWGEWRPRAVEGRWAWIVLVKGIRFDKLLGWLGCIGTVFRLWWGPIYLQVLFRGRCAGTRRKDGTWGAFMGQVACLLLTLLQWQDWHVLLAFVRVWVDLCLPSPLWWPALYVFPSLIWYYVINNSHWFTL